MAHGSGRRDLLAGLRGATAAAQSVGQQRIGAKRAKSQEEQRGIENVRAELAQTFRESRAKSEDEFRQSAQNLQEQKRADSIKQAVLNVTLNALPSIPNAKVGSLEYKQLANFFSKALGGEDAFKLSSSEARKEVSPKVKEAGLFFGAKEKLEEALSSVIGEQATSFAGEVLPSNFAEAAGRQTLFEGGGLRQPLQQPQEGQEGLPLLQDLRTAGGEQKPFFSLEPEKLGAVTEEALEALPPGSAFKQEFVPKPPPGVHITEGSGSVKELVVRAKVQSVVDNVSSANINEAEKEIAAMVTGFSIGDLLPDERDAALDTLAELRMFNVFTLGQEP